ncbi:MAG: gliding motility-associated C-terminal domain-containing protein [Bacteroidales bacterium]|nr:gliding motility-associated C-terminal domain-containing protein [Bacteroidales bacterium]
MKRMIIYLTTFLLAIMSPQGATSQAVTTMGTDFWFSFMKGRIEAAMSVTVTSQRACSGVVTNPNTGWSQSFQVPAGAMVTIHFDTVDTYNYESNAIRNKAMHLTTTDTVSVYTSNFLATSFDATFVLPTPVLRDDYMIQDFKAWKLNNPAEILIVALHDSTVVDINATAYTKNMASGVLQFTKVLNAGQCYFMQSVNNSDYSGTTIHSRDCKPIAVFNGHECAHIPENSGTYCDHLYEQSVPTVYWGNKFVVTKSLSHDGDYVKVTALENNCAVFVGGTQMTTLNAGSSYSFTLQGANNSKYIYTSKPATVYSYLLSKNIAGPDGDPSMIFIAPIEQQLKDVIFVNYHYSEQLTNHHYVNIVTRTDNTTNIFLDNANISHYFFPVSGNSQYSFAQVAISPGFHRLRSSGTSGFVAHAYGVGANESYGYSVGFSAVSLTTHLYMNDVERRSGDTLNVCVGDSVKIYTFRQDTISHEGWYTQNGFLTSDDTISYQATTPGFFHYYTFYQTGQGCFQVDDTVHCYVKIGATGSLTVDTVVCADSLVWNGATYYVSGTYCDTIVQAGDCVSFQTLNLQLGETHSTYIDAEACDSIVINGIPYYQNDTVPIATFPQPDGCDSVVYKVLNIKHSVQTELNVFIDQGDTITWIDGNQYYDESVSPTYRLTAANGCDSILRLNIHVVVPPPVIEPDSSEIWVPNAFTPEGDNNNVFQVFGYDLNSVHVYIFSRWGNFLLDFDGLTEVWDGTYKGHLCKEEAYVYLIEYTTQKRPDIVQKLVGTVTLLR